MLAGDLAGRASKLEKEQKQRTDIERRRREKEKAIQQREAARREAKEEQQRQQRIQQLEAEQAVRFFGLWGACSLPRYIF